MKLSNVRLTSAAPPPHGSPPPVQTADDSPSAAAFAQAIQHRAISGSSAHTIFGVGMLLLCLVDLARGTAGHGGVASLLVSAVGKILPDGLLGPGLALALVLCLQLLVLLWSSSLVLSSPWRRWLRPALHSTLPFVASARQLRHAAARTTGASPVRQLADLAADGVLFLAVLLYELPVASATGRMVPGGLALGGLALVVLAYAATWVLRAIISRVSQARTLASGDRDTVIALGTAVLLSLPVALASRDLDVSLARFHLTGTSLDIAMVAEFYVLLGALGLLAAQYFATFADGGVEVFRLRPDDRNARIAVPDCTGGDYKPFHFRVDPGNQQVVLLSSVLHGADAYQVCTTLDEHDATLARYQLINLSQIHRNLGQGVSFPFRLLNGHFECTVPLRLFARSPETFLERLREGHVRVPASQFSAFSDSLLSTNQFESFLRPTIQRAVIEAAASVEAAGERGRSDVRAGSDALRSLALQAKARFQQVVTEYQDVHRSVYERDRMRNPAHLETMRGEMNAALAEFDRQFGAARARFQGGSHLETVIQARCQEVLGSLVREHGRFEAGATLSEASELLFGLLQFEVGDVVVTASAQAAPVDDGLATLQAEVHQAYSEALATIREILASFGIRFDEPINIAIASPTTPYAIRGEIIGGQLRPQPSPAAVAAAPAESLAGAPAPDPGAPRPRLRIRPAATEPPSPAAPPGAGGRVNVRPAGPADEPF